MATFWVDLATANPLVTVIVTDTDANGTILAVGDQTLVSQRRHNDRVESLSGGFVTPGFWDSHVHLLEWGRSFSRVRCQADEGLDQVLSKVRQRARDLAAEQWLIGVGWNRQALGRDPDIASLDQAADSHPALMVSLDYHTVWLNHLAIERLELRGEEARRASQTGILREDRAFWAQDEAARLDEAGTQAAVSRAVQSAGQAGFVGVTAMEDRHGLLTLAASDAVEGRLRIQLFLRHQAGRGLLHAGISQGFGYHLLTIMGVKLFVDGALGSHTAWMREPYAEEPGNMGICALSPPAMRRWASLLTGGGLLAAVHAIGDQAVHEAARALQHRPGINGAMHRIEHAQLLGDADLDGLMGSAVGLSMQPAHLLVDRDIADRYWGARSRGAFRFADILRSGIPLAFGSDAPIAPLEPVSGLWAAVHRARPGDEPWYPDQRITSDEAIWCYTRGPAILDGRPSGLIEPGYWGDLTVWREDPRIGLSTGEPERLAVQATIVAGRRVFGV